jgi:hypothetical protein
MAIDVRVLLPNEAHVLDHVADDVFDHPIHPRWCAEMVSPLVATRRGCSRVPPMSQRSGCIVRRVRFRMKSRA